MYIIYYVLLPIVSNIRGMAMNGLMVYMFACCTGGPRIYNPIENRKNARDVQIYLAV